MATNDEAISNGTLTNEILVYLDTNTVAAPRKNSRGPQGCARVPVGSLRPSDSPRLAGENANHIRLLMASEMTFPPIIVNRSTMRVIDGMHRLRAAMLRGQDTIEVEFYDGDELDSFILAVEANIKHGLPLSLADRTAAAGRILRSHPNLSDRAIAFSTGLAAKTIAAIRRCSTADKQQLNMRLGRDGRIRPLDATEGRKIAAELINENPDLTLREIANVAGISLGTAKNVRDRLRRGKEPVPSREREDKQRNSGAENTDLPKCGDQQGGHSGKAVKRISREDGQKAFENLRKDPSVRFTEPGRVLIRMLEPLAISDKEWERLTCSLPPHCTGSLSNAARACAELWHKVADRLS